MIRLRNLAPWLAVLGIVVATRGIFFTPSTSEATSQLSRRPTVFAQGMRRREATAITADHWTEFQLNQTSLRVRVLTNAVVSRKNALREIAVERPLEDPRRGWRYGVDYELLDAAKKPIERSTYHFRSQTEYWNDHQTGETQFSIRLDRPGLSVAQTKVMQFAADAVSHPAYLRLRLGIRDEAVRSVFVRVFDQVLRPEHDKTKTWVRMSKRQRERLCSNSVFSSELLSIEERQNLLRLMWMPAVKHNDFKTESLFFLDQSEIERDDVTPLTRDTGILTGPRSWISIDVPDHPGMLHVATERAIESPDAKEHEERVAIPIEVQYQCGDADDRLSAVKSVPPGSAIEFPARGGLLVLKSETPARSTVTWSPLDRAETIPIELKPIPSRSRSFLVDETSVEFDVHARDLPTPIKLVLRVPDDPMFERESGEVSDRSADDATHVAGQDEASVFCELLDRENRVLKSFHILCSVQDSPLDRLEMFGGTGLLSVPTIRFFESPRSATTIRLTTNGRRVLATVYNRPPDLDQVLRIENPVTSTVHTEPLSPGPVNRPPPPAWFSIRPRQQDEMISTNRSFLVSSHRRPVKRDDQILAGKYQWHRFEPIGTWIGKDAMICQDQRFPSDANDAFAETPEPSGRGATSLYWSLTPNQDWGFKSYEDSHVRVSGRAKLIIHSETTIGRVTVRIDGEPIQTTRLSSRRGEIEIDRDLPDRGMIRVEANPNASIFLSGCVVPKATSYRRRTVQALNGGLFDTSPPKDRSNQTNYRKGAVHFEYEKLTDREELVSVKFYRPWKGESEHEGPSRLRLTLEDSRPQSQQSSDDSVSQPKKEWTIRRRTYEIDSPLKSESIVLDTGQTLGQAATCFMRLKSDLPKGIYRITVEPIENASDGYVLVSQTLAGDSPQRFLHTE